MSAFQVDEPCFYNVINLVSKCHGWNKNHQALIQEAKDKPESLFNKLVELNRYSLVERYGENNGLEFKVIFNPQGLTKSYFKSNTSQLLKSLECFSYQSCEGKAEKTDLYKWLADFKHEWMSNIINKIPEYEQAKWG
jgi:hypothetical protein